MKNKRGGARYDENGVLLTVKKRKYIDPVAPFCQFERKNWAIAKEKIDLPFSAYVNSLLVKDLKERGLI